MGPRQQSQAAGEALQEYHNRIIDTAARSRRQEARGKEVKDADVILKHSLATIARSGNIPKLDIACTNLDEWQTVSEIMNQWQFDGRRKALSVRLIYASDKTEDDDTQQLSPTDEEAPKDSQFRASSDGDNLPKRKQIVEG